MYNYKNRRVLVVDDNRSIHDDFRKILSPNEPTRAALSMTETQLFGSPLEDRQAQYEMDSAYQGGEGVEMVRQSLLTNLPYAAVFVDMRMPPGWHGIRTVQEIWKIDPEIQVSICTAYSAYSWEEILEQIGENDRMALLKKPFDTVELLRVANELTDKWWVAHFDRKRNLRRNAESK